MDYALIPYCGPAPARAELLTRWNLDPLLLAALGALALAHALDWRRRPDRQSSEAAAFASAWLALVLLFVSPLCAWSSSLFSVRVAHHVVLIAIVAPLLVLARPLPSVPSRIPAFAIQAAVLWVWHVPALYSAALSHHGLFWLMQLSLLASAVLAWGRVLAPVDDHGAGHALAGLLGTIVQMGFLGALITFAGQPLYEPHLLTTGAWGLSALEDQQLAGLIMWVPAMLPYLAAGLWIAASLLREGEAANAQDAR